MKIRRPMLWVCLVLAAAALLHFRWSQSGNKRAAAFVDSGQWEVLLEGRVCARDHEKYQIDSIKVRGGEASRQVTANSLQCVSGLEELHIQKILCIPDGEGSFVMPKIGSRVVVAGQFETFGEATNPGEFSFARYYQSMDVGGRIWGAIILGQGEKYNRFREGLAVLRSLLGKRLEKIYEETECGIMKTLLLGDKGDLATDIKDLYKKGGILHILSISGLHISLLGMGIFGVLRRFGISPAGAGAFGGLVLFCYGIMTGMSISAVRAIGMFLIHMMGAALGRTYDLPTALGMLLAGMLCLNPADSLNGGFWLSFGSMVGIGGMVPMLEVLVDGKLGHGKPGVFGWRKHMLQMQESVKKSLRAGLAITITTLPLQLWLYYEVPVFSMIINLLIMPFMPLVLFVGFVTMLIPGTDGLAIINTWILRVFQFLCREAVRLPMTTWNPGCPAVWQIILYYGALGSILLFWYIRCAKKEEGGGWRVLMCLLLPVALLSFCGRRFDGITFLDVGQGDCTVVHSGGEVWIYDCGSTSRKSVGERVLLPYLKYYGYHHIHAVFFSHEDRDHISGLEELFGVAKREGIRVDNVFAPDSMAEYFANQETSNWGRVSFLNRGDTAGGKDWEFTILNPPQHASWKDNEMSLCLWVSMGKGGDKTSVLLTGDAEKRGEESLIHELTEKSEKGFIDVLKVSHHGSKNATSDDLLDQIKAGVAVVSCGKNNIYGHPHEELLLRLEKREMSVYRTDLHGAVSLKKAGGVLWIKTWGTSQRGWVCLQDG